MFRFQELLDEPLALTVVDVGAASMGKDSDAYAALLAYGDTVVHGFEPNEAACAERNASAPKTHRFLPHFIGDGTARTFYICENPLTSSLYEPDAELLSRFQCLDLPVASTTEVKTTRLDDTGIAEVDFLKLDIQGAELDAINGGTRVLSNALVVHTEIEFIAMYKGQALFGDIDVALRRQGFMFHNFVGLFSRQYRPMVYGDNLFSPGSQLLFAEAAIYIRDLAELATLPRLRLLKLAAIMHDVYRAFDLVLHILDAYGVRFADRLLERYAAKLAA